MTTIDQRAVRPHTARRRKQKAEAILSEIRVAIRSGRLQAGERLASVRELMASFAASQRVVTDVIRQLTDEGLVVSRERSGCFVADCTQMAAPAAQVQEAVQTTGGAAAGELRLGVMDRYPEQMSLLQDTLAARSRAGRAGGLRQWLVPCEPGQDTVLAYDVLETTLQRLAEIGRDRFAPIGGLRSLASDLHPAVPRLSDDVASHCVPHSVAVSLIFVNLDLLAACGLPTECPADPLALLVRARSVAMAERAAAVGLAFEPGIEGMRDWLMAAGALSVDGDSVTFRPRVAQEFLQAWQDAGCQSLVPGSTVAAFRAGSLAFCLQSSFVAIECLRQDLPFRWAAWPVPTRCGGALRSTLVVLAVDRQSYHPQVSLDVVSSLTSPEAQLAYGRLGGNLPVDRQAVEKLATDPTRPAQLPDPRVILASAPAVWTDDIGARLHGATCLASALSDGTLSVDAAVERIEFAIRLLPTTVTIDDSAPSPITSRD